MAEAFAAGGSDNAAKLLVTSSLTALLNKYSWQMSVRSDVAVNICKSLLNCSQCQFFEDFCIGVFEKEIAVSEKKYKASSTVREHLWQHNEVI